MTYEARMKNVHFSVIILGNFYSIIGTEIAVVKIKDRSYRATNYLVGSPRNAFEEYFLKLIDEIEDRFSQFRFIPFAINRQSIAGLNVHYTEQEDIKVFNALFNDQIDTNISFIGDRFYRCNDWMDSKVQDGKAI